MSTTNHGQGNTYVLPAPKPASGLFFLCTFLLLIGIPASSYVEIWAKACTEGNVHSTTVLGANGMTMQDAYPRALQQAVPVAPLKRKPKGGEIAGAPE
jgi:hypothetical protein